MKFVINRQTMRMVVLTSLFQTGILLCIKTRSRFFFARLLDERPLAPDAGLEGGVGVRVSGLDLIASSSLASLSASTGP